MMELAMGLSMATMFTQVMQNSFNNTPRGLVNQTTQATPPPKYIHAIIGGVQRGPFSLGEVAELIRSGEITLDTYMWKPGMQEWQPAKEVADIGIQMETTPPQAPKL